MFAQNNGGLGDFIALKTAWLGCCGARLRGLHDTGVVCICGLCGLIEVNMSSFEGEERA